MTTRGRKCVRLYVPALAVICILLLILPDMQPSVADMSPAVMNTENAQPAGLQSSSVMAEAVRVKDVELVDGGAQFLVVGSMVKTGPRAIPDQGVYQAVLTRTDFVSAEAQLGDHDRPTIKFTLTPAGDARLAAYTAELHGYYLCLAIDGRVVNCPILRTPLTNRRGIIELTGEATLDDARQLAVLLRSGTLPLTRD